MRDFRELKVWEKAHRLTLQVYRITVNSEEPIYPISMIPTGFRTYLYLNPAFPFIELFQQILLRQTMEPKLLGIATIWTALSLFLGTFFFERLKHSFADVL